MISLFTSVGIPQQASHTSSSVQIDSRSGTLIGTPSETLSQQVQNPTRGESLSSSSTTTNKEPSDSHSGDCATPTQSTSSMLVGGASSITSSATGTTVHHGTSYLAHSLSLQQQQSWKVQTPRLRFVSSVEFRHSSGETSTTPLSPESPVDDSSGEAQKPSRLQRSKAQSRKTFRIRRGRQNHGETVSHSTDNSQELPKPPIADLSWDSVSQTSSTSGYRDNYSIQTSLLSPDGSLSGTAPIGRSSSQHSLLMLFEAQDEENTLI